MSKENKNKITVTSVILINILAILGTRWLAFAAKYGAASIIIWIAAAFLMFIPLSFICAEFGAVHPDKEAAITDWVHAELGEKYAFYTSWFYFVAQIFYLPTLLTFTGICFAYAFDPALASNKLFISSFVIIAFWVMVIISTRSLEFFKKTSEFTSFAGILLPIFLLILAAIISVFFLKNKIPTDFSPNKWIPSFNLKNLLFLVGIGSALAGSEVSAPFVTKMKNPQKTFPIAIISATIAIIICYIIATLAIILVVAPHDFNTSNGIFEVMLKVLNQIHLGFVASIAFILIAIGNLGAMILWLVSPTKMLIDGNDPKIFPKIFLKKTSDNLPINAIIAQGLFITAIIILGNGLSTVDNIYNVLVMATSILMFVAYGMLLIAYLKMKFRVKEKTVFQVPGGKIGGIIAFTLAFSVCIINITIPIVSIPERNNFFIYELEVIGIPVLMGMLGLLLYRRKNK